MVTEVFSRYLATRPKNKKLIFNNFFISLSFLLVRPFHFLLQGIVRPKKKIFNNSEQDIMRLFRNIANENILEKQEVNGRDFLKKSLKNGEFLVVLRRGRSPE